MDIKQKTIERFQKTWILRLLNGSTTVPTVTPEYVIDDGRRRAKVWRELEKEGYQINDCLTDKAFQELESAQPILEEALPNGKRDAYFWESWPAIPLERMSLPQQKWVVTHPEDYEFVVVDSRRGDSVKPAPFGTYVYEDRSVSDVAYRSLRNRALYDLRFASLKQRNLAWAMEEIVGLTEEQAKCFQFSDGMSIDLRSASFGAPEDWENQTTAFIEVCGKKVEEWTQRREVMLIAQAKINALGGWAWFHRTFDEKLHAHLASKGEKTE